MEAGKLFIEDALVAPWRYWQNIGKIEKSGNQINHLAAKEKIEKLMDVFIALISIIVNDDAVQGMKSKEIYSSSRRRNLKGPEIQFYKTNCFLNHPFDSVVDKGNNSKKLSTGVDVVRL